MARAYAALVLIGLIWGSNFIFIKISTEVLTPMQVVLLRVAAGFVPLALVAWQTGALNRAQLRHLPHFAVMSVLATSFYYYGFVAGTFIGVMLQGLVQTYIVFDGTLSSWWTKIVVGVLLFMFIVLQRLVFRAGPRRT